MKRLFPVLLLLVFILCGCGNAKPVTVYYGKYSAIVSIKSGKNNYKYKYSFDGTGNCNFEALNKTPGIDFCWNSNVCTLKCNNILEKASESIDNSYPAIVKYIIETNQNTNAVADYNGDYAIHGTASFGEYCLVLNNNGIPCSVTANGVDMVVEFTNVDLE